MKTRKSVLCWMGALLLGLASAAQATLIDNGDGTITDTSTGLMWLKDANYARTSGYDADGRMTWGQAMAWADGLVFAGYDDWRLPLVFDSGNDGCNWGYSDTDCGVNVDTATGELAHMFHDVLGNQSKYNPDRSQNSVGCSDVDPYCVQNTSADGVEILNLQSYAYWSGTEYAPSTGYAWLFDTLDGAQFHYNKGNALYAWAVRSGQAADVPEPATVLLMGFGLAGLGMARRGSGRRR